MRLDLADYPEQLQCLPVQAQEILRATWPEAVRCFSRTGLDLYLQGARSLAALGRGPSLVETWLEDAPGVAKALDEQVLADLLHQSLQMASKTSGAVIELVLATSPTAARRLGDAALFRSYLQLLNTLVAQAPRGIRPLLEHLEPLLGQLTLGGLRRWVHWGIQAHRNNFDAQVKYFALESGDAQAVLQDERKGTLFVDIQRRLQMYLRALWGRDFFLRPTSGDFEAREGYRPSIEDHMIHLPDAYDDLGAIKGLVRYRAAAAHAAAHLAYTCAPLPEAGLTPLQKAVVATLEDARIEQLAIDAFPGLRDLWQPFHDASPALGDQAGALLARLARALIDAAYPDPCPWIADARARFSAGQARLADNRLSLEVGLHLASSLVSLTPGFAAKDAVTASYRDDNRYTWAFAHPAWRDGIASLAAPQVRRSVNVMEMVNAIDVPGAGEDAQEIWTLSSEFFRDEEPDSINAQEGRPPVAPPCHYPEWDYQIQLVRPAWCTVIEKRPITGDLQLTNAIIEKNRPVLNRLKYLIEALQPHGLQRLRRQENGDEIDLGAAVRCMVERRQGAMPDERVHIRLRRQVRDLSVQLLLDLSESTNDRVRQSGLTVLDLTREATVLLARAMQQVGDPFAIHGFASNGRHEVEYYRFKDFEAPYDDLAKARLAGMQGQHSTRMGAAIRHAGGALKQCQTRRRLLLIVTDGEPADIDVADPHYLRADARKAVEELARAGIRTFCLSLDPNASQYVEGIFGPAHYQVLDRIERLPEKLPMLYMGLTG